MTEYTDWRKKYAEWNEDQLKQLYTPGRFWRLMDKVCWSYNRRLVALNESDRNQKKYKETDVPITYFKSDTNDLVIRECKFISVCEHHHMPVDGKVWVAYVPRRYMFGLSKIDDIVNFYAGRLNLQERMGQQIADWIFKNIEPKGVMVVIKAKHYCAEMQGRSGLFVTSAIRGGFKKQAVRMEVLELIK